MSWNNDFGPGMRVGTMLLLACTPCVGAGGGDFLQGRRHPKDGPLRENPGLPEARTHVSPGGSSHRTPGLGHWRPCSCSSHCPWPVLLAGRGNGIRLLHKSQPCLLVSSQGHLPGTRSGQALGSLKLQGEVKDVRLPETALCLRGRRYAGPKGEARAGVSSPPNE